MSNDKLVALYCNLKEAAIVLSSLGLYKSAKWAAEALNGIPPLSASQRQQSSYFEQQRVYIQAPTSEVQEQDKIVLAKMYFDCKEFDRVAHLLKDCSSSKAVFLKLYSLYLGGEKKLQEEYHEILGEKQLNYENKNVSVILKEIDFFFSEHETDLNNSNFNHLEKIYYSLLYYLSGIIFLKQKDFTKAQNNFLKSLKLYQYNWECWNDLVSSCSSFDESVAVIQKLSALGFKDNTSKTPESNSKGKIRTSAGDTHEGYDNVTTDGGDEIRYENIMMKIFCIVVYQEFYQQNIMLYTQLNEVIETFPNFVYLKTQKALISYKSLNYPLAESLFDEILVSDPYNLDHMDTYSNILYVMENKSKLSFLAQFANSIDKFRPETCCIIANYYSLKFEHEKAIMYYKRALNLDKNCLSAWTLMGHEFVELKNSHAAIESYRRAVDINQKDFRAWYGLGQAYEVLDMYLYSLYYYQRSCELKPLDKRMWTAVGNCYEKLSKFQESIKSYKKILSINMNEEDITFVLFKLGKLYEMIKDYENAETYMKLCLNEEVNNALITEESNKARLWLAKRELQKGQYKSAYKYASEFHNGTSQEIEEARSIVRECRNR